MKLIDAQNIFAVRLYDWSLGDFIREMEEGCPLMSLVGLNNRMVAAFVSWTETMQSSERETLAKALVRGAHENAAALRGESLTKEERKHWNEEFFEQTATREHLLPPLTTADTCAPSFKSVNPDRCLDILALSLSPLLGRVARRKSGSHATRKIGEWKLITEFTFYRRDRDLRFEYQFVRGDGGRVIGHTSPFPRTLFWFYGVSTTNVVVPSEADTEPMAKAMATLAEYFVARADPLFKGLGIDD